MRCDSPFPDRSQTPARFAFNFPSRSPRSSLFPPTKEPGLGY